MKRKTKFSNADVVNWVNRNIAPLPTNESSSAMNALRNAQDDNLVYLEDNKWLLTDLGQDFLASHLLSHTRVHSSGPFPEVVIGDLIDGQQAVTVKSTNQIIGFIWKDYRHLYKNQEIRRYRLITDDVLKTRGNSIKLSGNIAQLLDCARKNHLI